MTTGGTPSSAFTRDWAEARWLASSISRPLALRIAETQGTPTYVYNLDKLRRNGQQLVRQFSVAGLQPRLLYSIKANPFPPILSTLHEAGFGFETSSAGELKGALRYDKSGASTILLGPGKPPGLIRYAARKRVLAIVVESFSELRTAVRAADPRSTAILIRVNIPLTVRDLLEVMTGNDKFGIHLSDLTEAWKFLRAHFGGRAGLHYYLGSQFLRASDLLHLHSKALRLLTPVLRDVDVIDIGGGIGVPYGPRDRAFPLRNFTTGFSRLCRKYLSSGSELWMEFGRFLVAESGVLLVTVADVKPASARQQMQLVLDSGFNAFLRPILTHTRHAIVNLTARPGGLPVAPAAIGGPLCTPLDSYGESYRMPRETRPGDVLAIADAGAYGLTLSPILFLNHPVPREVAIQRGAVEYVARIAVARRVSLSHA